MPIQVGPDLLLLPSPSSSNSTVLLYRAYEHEVVEIKVSSSNSGSNNSSNNSSIPRQACWVDLGLDENDYRMLLATGGIGVDGKTTSEVRAFRLERDKIIEGKFSYKKTVKQMKERSYTKVSL